MKEGVEEESAVGYTVQWNLKQLLLKVFIFEHGHAVVFEQSSFLSGMLFREMITIKGSLIHCFFSDFYIPLPL